MNLLTKLEQTLLNRILDELSFNTNSYETS